MRGVPRNKACLPSTPGDPLLLIQQRLVSVAGLGLGFCLPYFPVWFLFSSVTKKEKKKKRERERLLRNKESRGTRTKRWSHRLMNFIFSFGESLLLLGSS